MNHSTDSRHRRFDWRIATFVAVALVIISLSNAWPPLPRVLQLKVTFPAGQANRTEPLLCTGEFGNGDLLLIKYQSEHQAVIAYDCWGLGGPTSAPFEFVTGQTYNLAITMPSLTEEPGRSNRSKATLKVSLDQRDLVTAEVSFHHRKPKQIYFATNPIGGSAEPVFRGTIRSPHDHSLIGTPAGFFTLQARTAWLCRNPVQLLSIAILSTIVGVIATPVRRRIASAFRPSASAAPQSRSPIGWIVATATIAMLAFTYTVTDRTFKIIFPESFGNFYDYQALSLLHGHLDVPEAALSGEAFIVNGKYYGYFGVTPALLRLPFAAVQVGAGQLSRLAMICYFAAALAAVYSLLRQASRMLYGDRSHPSTTASVLLIACAGLGSTLFFLGSRAYIYHEANLCGATFALWSVYHALRHLEKPAEKSWVIALVLGVLSLHARPPTGLFALCVLGTVALVHLGSLFKRTRAESTTFDPTNPAAAIAPSKWRNGTRHLGIATAALIGILSFNGLSYAKFGTFDGAPLQFHVQYDAKRLARFNGTNFHWSNVAHNAQRYLVSPAIYFDRHFPWISFGVQRHLFPEAKIDIEEATMSLPLAMAGLAAAAIIGGIYAAASQGRGRVAVFVLTVGCLPMALALFAAIATSHRYTADFCPYLVATAAFGISAIDRCAARLRRLMLGIVGAFGATSVAITIALTLQYQNAMVWGVPEEAVKNYQQLCRRVDHFFGVDH